MRVQAQHLARTALPALLALNIAAFAAASSSIPDLTREAHTIRWLVLALLGFFSFAAASAAPRPRGSILWLGLMGGLLVLVSVESTFWSVDPRLTFHRAGSLALLLVAVWALGIATSTDLDATRRVVIGALAGIVIVAFAGLLLAVVDPSRALQAPIVGRPARLRGLGENPNTVPLLCGVGLTLAVWSLRRAVSRRGVTLSVASFTLLFGTILWSGSRGALFAGLSGILVFLFVTRTTVTPPASVPYTDFVLFGTGFAFLSWLAFRGAVIALVGLALCVLVPALRLSRQFPSLVVVALCLVGLGAVVQSKGLPSRTSAIVASSSAITTRTVTTATATSVTTVATTTATATHPGSTGVSGVTGLRPPSAATTTEASSTTGVTTSLPPPPALSSESSQQDQLGRLEDELGRPQPGQPPRGRLSTILTGSGRLQAWEGAIGQGGERLLAGYGFGTEDHVFIDRFYFFQGVRPENSYIGLFLQLGIAGVLVMLGMALPLVRGLLGLVRRPPTERSEDWVLSVALGAAVVAGALTAIFQSYLYSVGDIATVSFWACAFLFSASLTRQAIGEGAPA